MNSNEQQNAQELSYNMKNIKQSGLLCDSFVSGR